MNKQILELVANKADSQQAAAILERAAVEVQVDGQWCTIEDGKLISEDDSEVTGNVTNVTAIRVAGTKESPAATLRKARRGHQYSDAELNSGKALPDNVATPDEVVNYNHAPGELVGERAMTPNMVGGDGGTGPTGEPRKGGGKMTAEGEVVGSQQAPLPGSQLIPDQGEAKLGKSGVGPVSEAAHNPVFGGTPELRQSAIEANERQNADVRNELLNPDGQGFADEDQT